MRIRGVDRRTIRLREDGRAVEILDQTRLPFEVVFHELATLADAAEAIASMRVRGAPLIGVTAAYGLCLALRADPSDASLDAACHALLATRPTAVNLAAALERMRLAVAPLAPAARAAAAFREAGRPLEILTHCNAGALATVDLGTALAPVYLAHDQGVALHVWV